MENRGPKPEPKRKMAGIHYKGFKRDAIILAGLIIIYLLINNVF